MANASTAGHSTATTEPVTEGAILKGPYEHGRYGVTLEVRPTVCLTRTGNFPSQALVVTTAAQTMIPLSKGGQKLKALLVAGAPDPNGGKDAPPTQHPEFREISENLRELGKKWFPRASFTLEAGPLDLSSLEVHTGLFCYDRPVIRFAAGTQKTFAALTGYKPGDLKDVVANLTQVEHGQLVIEAEFVRGDIDNSTESEVRGLVKFLNAIRPARVEVWTPPKPGTIRGKKTRPVTKTRMAAIQEQLSERTGLQVEAIGA